MSEGTDGTERKSSVDGGGRRAWSLALILAGVGVSGCEPAAPAASPTAAQKKVLVPLMARGSRLHPDHVLEPTADGLPSSVLQLINRDRPTLTTEGGQILMLADRMRIRRSPNGGQARAAELFPMGETVAAPLPARLGGGFVFVTHASGGTSGFEGTLLWRAQDWLGPLVPLARFSWTIDKENPVVAGFDRLYVRFRSGPKIVAIDAKDGDMLPLTPLPPASAYGDLVFADGWRAVVDVDLRGPLATFDAGATWRPIELPARLDAVSLVGDDPVLAAGGATYSIDVHGHVAQREEPPPKEFRRASKDDAVHAITGPLGKRPLRVAVEDGWPDSHETAVVAREGTLARVSLLDGRVIERNEAAFPERQARCQAIRLGPGFGFVCGEPGGPTSVYAYRPPLAMERVLRFATPRFVTPSGNGAVVVAGSCTDAPPEVGAARPYCVRDAKGTVREVRVRGDVGSERVVALADGRVVVIIPPRPGASGQLSVITGSAAVHQPLKLPDEPAASAAELKRGMWLHGFEEREPGVLSGWVESGGPVVGVRIKLDGTVTAGELVDTTDGIIVSGRFALALTSADTASESMDGGFTWADFDLPRSPANELDYPSRACGPVGCALHGWVRTGWGELAVPNDLSPPPKPKSVVTKSLDRIETALRFTCEAPATVASRPKGKDTPAEGQRGGWQPLRDVNPPTLAKDELGLDSGSPLGDVTPLRAYAWGKKGADWSRVGRWVIRFDDRFRTDGGVRSSGVTAALWTDDAAAAEALGVGSHSYSTNWSAHLDPSGTAALVLACKSRACSFYSVAEGQPVLPIRDTQGGATFSRPLAQAAVRVGETWFFLMSDSADKLGLWRVDLGVAREVVTLPRPATRFGQAPAPRLVRRALGDEIGLLLMPSDRMAPMHVLPIDGETGAVGEPMPLGNADFGARRVEGCSPGQDGWLVNVSFDRAPEPIFEDLDLSLDNVEGRFRIDPGGFCLDALSAQTPNAERSGGAKSAAKEGRALGFPVALIEATTGKRAVMQCRMVEP